MTAKRCQCQDSNGLICGKEMTQKEIKQDGMCDTCASHVWKEMTSGSKYYWTHSEQENKSKSN